MPNSRVRSQRDHEEAEGLLSGFGPENKVKRRLLWVTLFSFLTVLAVIALSASWASVSGENVKTKRNVIFMISDGFGPASETFARSYYQYSKDLPYNYTSPLDEILIGSSRTRSSDSLVTDSAAGATAFSCAIKTYNAAIGVDPDQVPCGTVLESAKAFGLATGLVVTSRITHATPASFSAHVINRSMESEIAVQQVGGYKLGRQVDLLFGGGRCFFLPNITDDSCRLDDRDIIAEAKQRDFKHLTTREEFENIVIEKKSLPLLGLFTLDHMSYEIDRDPVVEPSLKEMSLKALQLLEKANSDSDKGFFLMIEGSRIDMAAHSNDAPTHVHEILAYHETIAAVREYVDLHPGTIMISVSDHETGGLTLSRQSKPLPEYLWYPDVIAQVRNSSEALAYALENYNGDDKVGFIEQTILRDGLGIKDVTDEEVAGFNSTDNIEYYLANLTSTRALLGWTTHGHTGVDVNLYAYGLNAEKLAGNHENTELGNFLIDFLGLDLDSITEQLNQGNVTFHLDNHSNITRFNIDKLKHYHSG